MPDRFKLIILLQGLTLFLLGPACEASSLGMTVHVEPLTRYGGRMVRAHFSTIAPAPCPALTGLCADGEDCMVHTTSLPFNGDKPTPGWCVRQWQKTVPSDYNTTITLGSNTTEFYVSMNAGPNVRENSGRLNNPAYVALPPPLRARMNCPHHFHLSVKDLDGDKVRCRYALPDQGECLNCTQHSFIELNEEKCMFTFTGKAPAGQYFIHLMAEDFIPVPKISQVTDNKPLSSIPVHLSLTVEEKVYSCTDEPVATDDVPPENTMLSVLPYQEMKFDINFMSEQESVLEVAVVGPPELFRFGFKTVGPLAMMTVAWIRSENKLPRLLPICFAANTKSLQSEPRCVWLYQREMKMLPAGTELTCDDTEMLLVLPITSLSNIDPDDLQLNSPSCPITYNDTHLTAHISLNGCGTKAVHSGSELVYTNTLQSVRPFTVVSHLPSLILPLACRIPGVQAKQPQYQISMPTEKETFGELDIWIEVHLPGEGPMSNSTRTPRFLSLQRPPNRVRREASNSTPSGSSNSTSSGSSNSTSSGSSNSTSTNSSTTSAPIGSKLNFLDLHLMSNCSIDRAEMIVSNCLESETEDFAVSHPILEQGCSTSSGTVEIVTTTSTSKVYRIDLNTVQAQGTTMFIRCTVNLCISTLPSLKCPDLCARGFNQRAVIGSLFTNSFTIDSGAVSLVVTPAPPTATTLTSIGTDTPNTNAPTQITTSHAPEQASAMATGVILTTISVFLQKVFLY